MNSKGQAAQLKRRHGIPSPLKAIRRSCIECTAGSRKLVAECNIPRCPLWPFRFGRNPKPDDLRAPVLNAGGDLAGWQKWNGYGKRMNCQQGGG